MSHKNEQLILSLWTWIITLSTLGMDFTKCLKMLKVVSFCIFIKIFPFLNSFLSWFFYLYFWFPENFLWDWDQNEADHFETFIPLSTKHFVVCLKVWSLAVTRCNKSYHGCMENFPYWCFFSNIKKLYISGIYCCKAINFGESLGTGLAHLSLKPNFYFAINLKNIFIMYPNFSLILLKLTGSYINGWAFYQMLIEALTRN